MGITEVEASKKWCPHAAVVFYPKGMAGAASGNRQRPPEHIDSSSGIMHIYSNPSESRCIASHCMAWRWLSPAQESGICGLSTVPDTFHHLAMA
jgi:hypothetical protein